MTHSHLVVAQPSERHSNYTMTHSHLVVAQPSERRSNYTMAHSHLVVAQPSERHSNSTMTHSHLVVAQPLAALQVLDQRRAVRAQLARLRLELAGADAAAGAPAGQPERVSVHGRPRGRAPVSGLACTGGERALAVSVHWR
jgi:hypothetical protein